MQMDTHIDGDVLRSIMRKVPSPVAVVTAVKNGEARGITISSFASASLDPPLISFNVGTDAQMHPLIHDAERYAVHVLTDRQVTLSNRFAIPDAHGADQFRGVPHSVEEDGLPVLDGVLAVFFCRPFAVYPAGDHSIIVGEVTAVQDGEPGRPVLYYNRSYREVGDEVTLAALAATNAGSNAIP